MGKTQIPSAHGSPAQAGIDPWFEDGDAYVTRFPRASGDRPLRLIEAEAVARVPPRKRG